MEIIPADQFTYDELVDAYNRTRVDYIVPMSMDVDSLCRYIRIYDVDLEASCVAVEDGKVLGLGMLGVRAGHTWITRLGVLPVKRKNGTGHAIMQYLIEQSRNRCVDYITLDVIKENDPAHRLFHKFGFREVRELLIVERPAGYPTTRVDPYTFQVLDYHQAIHYLGRRYSIPSWLDEAESLINAGDLAALRVDFRTDDWGWIVYQQNADKLARLVLQTESGDPYQAGMALIHALHTLYPASKTKSENLPADSPYWPVLQEMGYVESFRRIEMRLDIG